jgi:transposase-like protein
MTTHEVERLRRELQRRGGARGKRFDPELRRRIVAFAEHRRRDGASWAAIATELGACFETVRRWCGGGSLAATRQLRRVEIVAEPIVDVRPHRALAVVTPNGLRIEGGGIEDVVALVRALG